MAENANCTVYVGNLDERVSDRVLYDILIEAGRVVDLYIPRDRETDKLKGYAFAQYETEEIAEYAVKLFSGFVTTYKKTLKFAISGKDKERVSLPLSTTPPPINSHLQSRSNHVPYESGVSANSGRFSLPYRLMDHQVNASPILSVHQSNGYRSPNSNNSHDHGRRIFGSAVDSITPSRFGRYDLHNSTNCHPPPY